MSRRVTQPIQANSKVADKWLNCCQIVADKLAAGAKIWPNIDTNWPLWATCSSIWAKFGRSSGKCGQVWATSRSIWANSGARFGQFRPSSGQLWPRPAFFLPSRPNLTDFCRNLAQLGPTRPTCGPTWQYVSTLGRFRALGATFRYLLHNFSAAFRQLGSSLGPPVVILLDVCRVIVRQLSLP